MVVGMAEDRDQGPHYIPELDPASKKFPGPSVGESIFFAVQGIVVGGSLAYVGQRNGEKLLMIISLISVAIGIVGIVSLILRKRHD